MGRIASVLAMMAILAAPASAAKRRPDLTVTVLHALPTAVSHNGKLNVHVWVRNAGRRAARASKLRFELSADGLPHPDDTRIATRAIGGLKARHSRHVGGPFRIPATAAPGLYHLVVCADPTHLVRERNEANNCRSHLVMITDGTGGPAVLAGYGTSITRAIQLAGERGLHEVDIVPGAHYETVQLVNGIDIYGAGATVFGPRSFAGGGGDLAGVAVAAVGLTKPTRLAGLTIVAPDESADRGRNSIGVLAAGDAPGSLVLSHVRVLGGKGGDGAGARPRSLTYGVRGEDGAAGGDAHLLAPTTLCDDGSSGLGGAAGAPGPDAPADVAGGAGGDGGTADTDCDASPHLTSPTAGDDGEPGLIDPLGFPGDAGLGSDACQTPDAGFAGLDGDDGADASAPAAGGAITGASWVTAAGAPGDDGENGTGGGGGGGSGGCDLGSDGSAYGAGGGGGGAGGTGGGGGPGGQGGGAAVGLLVIGGGVRVEASTIAGGAGGAGGGGMIGFPGAPGGFGGPGGAGTPSVSNGGGGGDGGSGGNGGTGGGGAGGPSAGALVAGGALDVDGLTTFAAGAAGAGGKGAVAGAAGVAVPVLRP